MLARCQIQVTLQSPGWHAILIIIIITCTCTCIPIAIRFPRTRYYIVRTSDLIARYNPSPSLSGAPLSPSHLLDNEDDYFTIDECSTVDGTGTSSQHSHSHHSTPENGSRNERNSNTDQNREKPQRLPSVYDSDYENTSSDGQILADSSDEESESIGRKRIVLVQQVQQEQDYVNSSDLDREMEIVTKGSVRHLVSTRSDALRGAEVSEPDYVNTDDDNTALSSTQEPDYMNTDDLINAQLFSDNIKLREDIVLSTSFGESMHPLRDTGETPGEVSCDPLPPGMVQRRFAPIRRCSTLHRESEIKIEAVEKVGVYAHKHALHNYRGPIIL